MRCYSELRNEYYNREDTVFIMNFKQAELYVKHRVKLIDVIYDRESLIFVFDRKSSKDKYNLWCKHELV